MQKWDKWSLSNAYFVEGMAQWLRRWTHDRKVVGSIHGPDRACVLEKDTSFHIVPVQLRPDRL